MNIFAHLWFGGWFSLVGLQRGPLRLRGAFSRGPGHIVEPRNARIIRAMALVIAIITWIDLALILSGHKPILN